jgi:hypothetical protein
MFAIVQNNEIKQIIQPHQEFTFNGTHYNAKWTVRMSDADKAALGVTDVVSEPRPDERFYWVQDNPVALVDGVPTITYMSSPKQLEDVTETPEEGDPVTTPGLKTQLIAQEKQKANSLLAATDWMVIRKAERGVDLPADVVAARQAILDECTSKESAISAATTIEELIAVFGA